MTAEKSEEWALFLRWFWRNYQQGEAQGGPNLKAWAKALGCKVKGGSG